MIAPATTPEERRAAAKAEWSRSVSRRLVQHGVSQLQIAECCGVDDSLVQRWCAPERADAMTPADVQLVAIAWPALGRSLFGDMVEPCACVVVQRHQAAAHALSVKESAALLRDASATVDAALLAAEDGVISPEERRDVLAKLHTLLVRAEGMRVALLADDVPSPKTKLAAVRT